ncbi:cysteine permease [Campylobacter hyointestinalis]|uniref:cysteine permease n=1 Tax=Campylobacter hyointestinalis TaxID=198 RepID=UPI000DCE6550|nr:cysteine permease [Campylobacter hyointestinalis]RAZ24328.1 cysteine permease [Campylobacter hyointestinalis subsp. lawsonii]RAZ37218.1 cysteine permease [Campylobacter hyointestinalis subsp. lawsonii]RAZ49944.1 cysteine permease [Campylobacter hyointestinalis subsp. lawsonii]
MVKFTLSSNNFLDDYVLNCEFCSICKISNGAYKFWKDAISASYQNSRTVFLHKKSIPPKYQYAIKSCSNLDGFVLASAFCSFSGVASSHLVASNGSNLHNLLEIKMVDKFKFVNLKKLYDDLGLAYSVHIYIEKCKYFSPTPFEKRIKITDTLCLGYY